MQYIKEDGTKRFAKGSRKEGCFHVIGGYDALGKTPVLVIAEGYATAATLSQAIGCATVAAFDSGNLVQVAKALHEKFPEKTIVIAGDDDKHLELAHGINPGRRKAEEAGRAVGGRVLLPVFAPDESSYPANLEPVSPEKFRKGALCSEQQAAAARKNEAVHRFQRPGHEKCARQRGRRAPAPFGARQFAASSPSAKHH